MNHPSSQRRPAGAETDRAISDLLRVGVIAVVDADAGKVQVDFGELRTPPIDWLMPVGDVTVWILPTVGQQVAVATPEGDLEQAFVLGGLPSSAMAPLFLGEKTAIRFADGATVTYDPAAGLSIETPGAVVITAADGVTINADLTVQGDVQVSKTLTAQTDVVGGGKSLKTHKHTGVTTGGGLSGAPQ
jgi:phage baseplate assembly protein V